MVLFNNCHVNFGQVTTGFQSQLKQPILEINKQIEVASVM